MKSFMRKMPVSLRIGPYDFPVETMSAKAQVGAGAIGEFSNAEGKIRILIDAPSRALAVDTMIHEINHAIFWAYHIQESDNEERTVAAMATAWTQVYRDNPGLLKWIAEGVRA